MADFGLVQEQFNNLTGDIELNPSSFGLFMRDIEEASLNLKTAIYSGNVNLTADFYKQISKIAEKKYALISPDGTLSGNYYERYLTENGELADYTMDGKSPGLYMDHQRLGYWNGTDWKAFIANTGEMFLGSITETNYLHRDGSTLTIKGNLILSDGTPVEDMSADRSTLDGIPYFMDTNVAPSGSGLKLTSSYLGFYNGSQWKTYMDNTGGLYLSGSGSNSLAWNGSTLTITGNIVGSTITGGIIQTASSGGRVELTSNNGLRSFDTNGTVRIRHTTDTGRIAFFTDQASGNLFAGEILGFNSSYGPTININGSNLSADNRIVAGGGFYSDSSSFLANIIPRQDLSYRLGSSSYRWSRIYTDRVYTSNGGLNFDSAISSAPYGTPTHRIDIYVNGTGYMIPLYPI